MNSEKVILADQNTEEEPRGEKNDNLSYDIEDYPAGIKDLDGRSK